MRGISYAVAEGSNLISWSIQDSHNIKQFIDYKQIDLDSLKNKFYSDKKSLEERVEILQSYISAGTNIGLRLQKKLLDKETSYSDFLQAVRKVQQETDSEYQRISNSNKISQISFFTTMSFIRTTKEIEDLKKSNRESIEMHNKHLEDLEKARVKHMIYDHDLLKFMKNLVSQIDEFRNLRMKTEPSSSLS